MASVRTCSTSSSSSSSSSARSWAALLLTLVSLLPATASSAPAATVATTCLAQPIASGGRAGGDYANHPVTGAANASHGAELCRASCCADTRCNFWGLDVSMPTAHKVYNCSHGQMCCWLKAKDASAPGAQCPWGCFTGSAGRTPQPQPSPPPPPPPPAAVPSIETECVLRQLALEYAVHLQPHRDHQHTHDALRLGSGCNRSFRPAAAPPAAAVAVGESSVILLTLPRHVY